MHYANDARTFLKHFSDCLFYFCSTTCVDCFTDVVREHGTVYLLLSAPVPQQHHHHFINTRVKRLFTIWESRKYQELSHLFGLSYPLWQLLCILTMLSAFVAVYRWRKKRGHPISLQIFWKFYYRIAWKLVKFCNIIYWTQSLTFCLKFSSCCGAT